MGDFVKNLRVILNVKGITQKELADISGVSLSIISKYLRGEVKPSPKFLKEVAEVLDVKTTELVGDEPLPTNIHIGGAIGFLRNFCDLTILELSKKSGINASRILKLQRGEAETYKLWEIRDLATALDAYPFNITGPLSTEFTKKIEEIDKNGNIIKLYDIFDYDELIEFEIKIGLEYGGWIRKEAEKRVKRKKSKK